LAPAGRWFGQWCRLSGRRFGQQPPQCSGLQQRDGRRSSRPPAPQFAGLAHQQSPPEHGQPHEQRQQRQVNIKYILEVLVKFQKLYFIRDLSDGKREIFFSLYLNVEKNRNFEFFKTFLSLK